MCVEGGYVCVHVDVCMCRGQRSTFDIFLDQFKPYIFETESVLEFFKRTELIEIYTYINDIGIYNIYVIYENGL